LWSGSGVVIDLRHRAADARELMDDPDCDPEALARTYRHFALLNEAVSDSAGILRHEIAPRARGRSAADPVRVLDVGTGGGDLPRALLRRAARADLPLEIVAIDPDRRAIDWARSQPVTVGLHLRQQTTRDVLADGERFDVVLSNHVIHHLDGPELGALLADSEALLRPGGVAVHHDLARSALGYVGYDVAMRVLQPTVFRGSFLRADGLVSIRRSHTPAELAVALPAGWSVTHHRVPWRLVLRFENSGG
jgi:2-polyprenyl-3-methyl-5-hydroxy-6-metoxy-1,4-benzoquinol methylase